MVVDPRDRLSNVDPLNLSLDAAWAAGFVLSMTRVAAFVIAALPLARAVPVPGRVAATVALSLFLTTPVEGSLTLTSLLGAGVTNALVGVTVGYLSTMILHVFGMAGGLIDTVSGLSVAAVLDPTRGEQGALFNRLFHMTAMTMFFATSGLELLVRGLSLSIDAIGLDGALAVSPGALLDVALAQTSRLMLVAAELALPVLSGLFLLELVLGLASRFAPQANVFILGLPAKLLITFMLSGVVVVLFPEAMGGVVQIGRDSVIDTLTALRTGG